MAWLSKYQLGFKLFCILNRLKVGSYDFKYVIDTKTYYVVLYDINNIGVYAGIYNPEHEHLSDALIRLMETIDLINKQNGCK